MSDSLSNKELVAVGHQFAKAMSSDTPIIDMAKIVSRLAERLDCTTLALREMTKQRAALAAENAGLNEKMNKLATWPGIEFYSSAWEFNGGDGDIALEFMCDTKKPATDAFLAEVRAQGVEMFAREMHADISEADAIEFAAKLRQGGVA
ncbi:hypothetical protein [Leclercia adecarboxylata]|uniref:hypothetical protein n=1 Tax=Leclercia adecarboxylata TaxID=83655 RepID=UPI002948EE9D|nr:hypothetical protein [Leclercia adecarboxylata]MDV5239173.1 hypothetical protein [Leclercia adecarboxylata]MDV5275712.1 hypothetical protein [Leclercia adecarboxylata]MDV5461704.1 hypothetical protein [Leclercia adecarboxylata]MDV5503148.1 hypothetical protein [Leclercia adecarboxylata]MDV5533258.1 hypothetical protein [Leclercia adecarboxylata]